ncbi:DUF6125 family protein [Chloroflexota bacterium]
MQELKDYSGPLKPDLKLEEFSKDMLLGLLDQYSRAWMLMDGVWHTRTAEKMNADEAMDGSLAVWFRYAEIILPRIAELAKIEITDIPSALKVWQIAPDNVRQGSRIVEPEYKIISPEHVILTQTYCCFLEFFERQGDGREAVVCKVTEEPAMIKYFQVLGLDVEVTPLKLPPRNSKDEIACQFDFKLKSRL